jgi:hypothetical protein
MRMRWAPPIFMNFHQSHSITSSYYKYKTMEDDSRFSKVVDLSGQDSKFRFLSHGKRVKRAGVHIARRVRADHEREMAPESVSSFASEGARGNGLH